MSCIFASLLHVIRRIYIYIYIYFVLLATPFWKNWIMSPGFGDRWLYTGWLVTESVVRFQQGRGIRVKTGVDQYRLKENHLTWPIKQVNHILIWFSTSLCSLPLTLILISYVSLSSHALLRKLLWRESHGSICSWYLPVPSPQQAACWCWTHGSDIRKQLFCYYVCHFISLCSFTWEDEVNSVMTFFFFWKWEYDLENKWILFPLTCLRGRAWLGYHGLTQTS